MQATDVPVVAALEALIYTHPWSAGNFRDSLAAGHCCTVAELGGGLVGYGVLMEGVAEAQLLNLSVAAQLRRQGVGRELFRYFIAQARKMGAQQLLLEVRVSNAPAIAFYEDMGCALNGRRKGYYPSTEGREDALLMSCTLALEPAP